MIWADMLPLLETSYAGAQGQFFGKHGNPNLMNAIVAMMGAPLNVFRSDKLIFEGGVSEMRFVRSRNYLGRDDGYLALVVVNGEAGIVVRSERLKDLSFSMFWKTEVEAFKFYEVLKRKESIPLAARVQFEVLTREKGFNIGGSAKVVAYSKFRSATIDLWQSEKTKEEFRVYALTAAVSENLTMAMAQANAWVLDAAARHAVAKAAYMALGGLIV